MKAEGTQRSPLAHLGNRIGETRLFFPPVKSVLYVYVHVRAAQSPGVWRPGCQIGLSPTPKTQGDSGHYIPQELTQDAT